MLIPYGDPVRDLTFHRAGSHALFWLALVTHALLDAFTVYGTQLLLPFSDYPVGVGSVFIIDPLFTVPLVVGLVAALRLRPRDPGRALRWNAAGLTLAALYLGWGVAAQSHVVRVVNRSLAATPRVRLVRHPNDTRLPEPLREDWHVQHLAWFSKGFYGVREAAVDTRIANGSASTMGQVLGLVDTAAAAIPARQAPSRRPPVTMLPWLWRRIWDEEKWKNWGHSPIYSSAQ